VTQGATILLAPQRKGYGVCGTVPPQLYVTTAQNLSITSIADDGASAISSSVADVPCPGAPSVRGWPLRLVLEAGVVWGRRGAAAAPQGDCCGNALRDLCIARTCYKSIVLLDSQTDRQ
jgi:hypothetical protein